MSSDLGAGGSRSADSEFVHLGPGLPGRGRALLPHRTSSTLYLGRGFIGRGTQGVQRGCGGQQGGSRGSGGITKINFVGCCLATEVYRPIRGPGTNNLN